MNALPVSSGRVEILGLARSSAVELVVSPPELPGWASFATHPDPDAGELELRLPAVSTLRVEIDEGGREGWTQAFVDAGARMEAVALDGRGSVIERLAASLDLAPLRAGALYEAPVHAAALRARARRAVRSPAAAPRTSGS